MNSPRDRLTTPVGPSGTIPDLREKMTTATEPMWRTKEMALAAYLACRGHRHRGMQLEGGSRQSVYWLFEETDDLTDQVFEFLEGKALVEPNEFNANCLGLKNEMFDYLKANGTHVPRRS